MPALFSEIFALEVFFVIQKNSSYFLCICLIGIILRISGLQIQSLSMDEVTEIHIAGLPLLQIIFKKDGFPPLYHLLLSAWMGRFHVAESARWLSVIFGCLTIPVIYKLGCLLGKKNSIGLWSAFLLAVSPYHIWYSQEARAYALFYLVAALALYFFFKAMDDNRRRHWLLFSICGVTGIYSHYYFIVLLICCAFIVLTERHRWSELKNPMLAFLHIGFFCMPSVVLLQDDMNLQENWPGKRPFDLYALGYTYFAFLGGLSLGPSMRELHTPRMATVITQIWIWLVLSAGVVFGLVRSWCKGFQKNNQLEKRLGILLILPLLLCGLLGYCFEVGYNGRYVVWVSIPVYIFLAMGFAEGTRYTEAKFALLALCCLFAVSLYNRRCVGRYMNEDVRSVAAYIMAHSPQGTPAFVQHKSEAKPLAYYLDDSWPVYALHSVKKNGEGLRKALGDLENNTKNKKFWFIYTRPFHGDPGGIFKKLLIKKKLVQKQKDCIGIEIYRGEFPQ